MIRFRTIRYRNFLSSGNGFTEIQLDSHQTTLIIGKNGAGKSTILDALSFGLYGKAFRKINKTQLVNSINKKNLEVEVEFTVGDSAYKVIRGIKPNVFEVYCDDTLLNQHATVRDYQDFFETEILKLNHASFSQIVVLGSSTYVPFMQLPSGARRDFIEDVLDLHVFGTMNEILKDIASDNRSASQTAEFELQSVESQIEQARRYEEALERERQKAKENIDEQIALIDSQIDTIENQIIEAEGDIPPENENEGKWTKYYNLSVKHLHENNAMIDSLKKQAMFMAKNDVCNTCNRPISQDERDNFVDSTKAEVKERRSKMKEISAKKEKYEGLLDEVRATSNRRSKLEQEIVQLRRSIDRLIQSRMKLVKRLEKSSETEEAPVFDVDALTEQLEVCKLNVRTFKQTQEIHKVASKILKDTGFKSKVIRQYIPQLNEAIEKFLAILDFYVQFELDENFSETIRSQYRDDFSYESFSEGQKMRIDLAVLFAMREIAKKKSSMSTNLLIMDEIFDSSLDEDGSDDFMKIISELNGGNVFVISHKTDRFLDRFERTITFVENGSFSAMVT